MRTATLLLLALSLTLLPSPAAACIGPPPHPGLWAALESSDAVVVGTVERVSPAMFNGPRRVASRAGEALVGLASHLPGNLPYLADQILPPIPSGDPVYQVRLEVREVLKGSVGRELVFRFENNGMEGGFGVPGEVAIVFLQRASGTWRPMPWLSSAMYFRNTAERDDVVSVLTTAQELQTAGLEDSTLRREWALAAASLPGSRPWLGSELLDPTPREAAHLAEAFVHLPSSQSEGVYWLLSRVRTYADADLDRAVLGLTSAALRQHGYQPIYFDLVAERLGLPDRLDEDPSVFVLGDAEGLLRDWLDEARARGGWGLAEEEFWRHDLEATDRFFRALYSKLSAVL